MILVTRLRSLQASTAGFAAVAVAFALGLGIGSGFAPAGRSEPALAPPAPAVRVSAPVRAAHAAEVLRVLDGDTFEARVHLWPGLDMTTRVRLRGIDAAELKASCPEELRLAEAASAALRDLLGEGDVTIYNIGPDKYNGRVVADAATARTPDVSAAMLASGHARSYHGGHRGSWCNSASR
jgi:endonuclease YncB( thermonuclease family)